MRLIQINNQKKMYDFFNQNDQENNTLLQFDNAVVNQFSCKCI